MSVLNEGEGIPMYEKKNDAAILVRIAELLLLEHLITPEEQIRFLANLKKEE